MAEAGGRRGTASVFSEGDLHVVLVEPEIPPNTGNVGRTCLAGSATLHLIRPLGFSLEGSRVRRAGLDYWPRVRPVIWSDWEAFEDALPPGWRPWAFSSEGPTTLWEARFDPPTVLLFGRESTGLPSSIREAAESRLLRIPMADPELRSLNLSTAVGIAVYEVRRRSW